MRKDTMCGEVRVRPMLEEGAAGDWRGIDVCDAPWGSRAVRSVCVSVSVRGPASRAVATGYLDPLLTHCVCVDGG